MLLSPANFYEKRYVEGQKECQGERVDGRDRNKAKDGQRKRWEGLEGIERK